MKKHAKKLLSFVLVMLLVVSAASISFFSSAASDEAPPNPYRLPEYTPSAGVETIKVLFAMPGIWTNDITEQQDNACGIYWWGGEDNPDDYPDANGHGWPGWKMKKESDAVNLYSSLKSKESPNAIFNNYIDSGMDKSYPEYDAAQQTMDLYIDYFSQGDSDYYPLEFWDYLYDTYFDDFIDDADYQIPEFGDYAKNFYYIEDEDSIVYNVDNMVYVVDTDPNRMQVSPISGKAGYDGAFYFYYGNGEFGIWPTKELLTSREGVEFDDEGSLIAEDEDLNQYGFVTRTHTDAYDGTNYREFVVYGKIDGEYWTNTEVPEPEVPTTEPEEFVEPATIEVDPSFEADPNKVYFQENGLWKNFKTITMYLYEHNGDELITWGSKKGNMTDEGNGLWSYDFNAKGITLEDGKQYGIIFTSDWGNQTCDIIFDKSCMGDIAYCTKKRVENNVDSNKSSYVVRWYNADPEKYAPPVCITSIGNVIGDAFWADETPESLFRNFIKNDSWGGLQRAIMYNGKTVKDTALDTGKALGLSEEQVYAIAKEEGIDLDDSEYPTYEPYPFNENAALAVEYIIDFMDDPFMVSPLKVREELDELEVTFDEVRETLYYYGLNYETYKRAEEILNNADRDYMDIIKGDVNRDGVVDILDATWIQKLSVDKITSFDEI